MEGSGGPAVVASLFELSCQRRNLTTHSTGARIALLSCARLGFIGGSPRPVNSGVRRRQVRCLVTTEF